MEPTVIGDTVNLASRLESLTKRYGQSLLFSGAVAGAVGGGFILRTIDTVRVVGRKAPVDIFTVPVDDDGAVIEPSWLPLNEEAWALYRRRDFDAAARLFGEALSAAPGDVALAQMLERCRGLLAEPPGPDWEPVLTLGSK
jgi:adenylate cyclase